MGNHNSRTGVCRSGTWPACANSPPRPSSFQDLHSQPGTLVSTCQELRFKLVQHRCRSGPFGLIHSKESTKRQELSSSCCIRCRLQQHPSPHPTHERPSRRKSTTALQRARPGSDLCPSASKASLHETDGDPTHKLQHCKALWEL